MNNAKTSTIAVRGTVASIITGKVNCGQFATINLKFAVGIAEFHLKPCRTWAREENLTRFSFHLMGENMGKMDFACWSRCINGLKTKSNAFERVLVLALRFLGLNSRVRGVWSPSWF
jgi:hypothetical protein